MDSQPPPRTAEAERRLSMRIPVNEKATLLLGHLASVMPCTLVDLSLDGCRVRTDGEIRLDRGARVELIFNVGGIGFRLGGELEWSARSREFGVFFTGMSSRREAELVEALGELAAKWDEKQAQAAAALELARATVERLSAEFEAMTAGETEARIALERAASEAREAKERLEASKKELSAAEEAVKEHAAARTEAENATARADANTTSSAVGSQQDKGADKSADNGADNGPTRAAGRRERRQQARHAVDSTATVFLVDVRSNVRGRIVDVSLSGCRIRSTERFPVGIYRRVEVEFILDGLPFRLGGVIQSIHDRFTAGIRFVDLSERKREQLSLLMEELDQMAGEAGPTN